MSEGNGFPKVHVKLEQLGRTPQGEITINGIKVPNTTNIKFSAPVGEIMRIELELIPEEIELELDGAVVVMKVGDSYFQLMETTE